MQSAKTRLLALATMAMTGMSAFGTASTMQITASGNDGPSMSVKDGKVQMTKGTPTKSQKSQSAKRYFGGPLFRMPIANYPKPGWSVAQDRRNARKARNVKRHKASR